MRVFKALLAVPVLLFLSCNPSKMEESKKMVTFSKVAGIKFIEVRRYFNTGFSFNEQGFQQEPAWTMYFLSDDSVKIYSPYEKRYIHYPIYFDHDSVFNFAREWLRLKKLSKDSVILQLLEVKNKVISQERSNVFMKFYSEDFIKNSLNKNPDSLKFTNRFDTLYIKAKVDRANRSPDKSDSAFAARNPVVLKSRSKNIKVEKVKASRDIMDVSPSDEYIYPEYTVTINNAYNDFNYSFSVLVDNKGVMRFGKSKLYIMPEFEASRIKVMKGIMEVYLQPLLDITPGNTLGMPHTSEITLNVKGIKGS